MFKKDALEKIVYSLKSSDPFIVTEVLYQIKKSNLKIKEVPISFLKRFSGKSKLKLRTLIEYLFKTLKLKFLGD